MMGLPIPPNRKLVYVKARFEALHNWPDAPPEVEFLRHPHRHEFHVEVHIGVESSDRELEFILVKRWLMNGPIFKLAHDSNTETMSCEHMAEQLGRAIQEKYGDKRYIAVGVYEDGENGGVVIWDRS